MASFDLTTVRYKTPEGLLRLLTAVAEKLSDFPSQTDLCLLV